MVKLKFKLLGKDPISGDLLYRCKLCKEEIGEETLDDHAKEHKRSSYMIDIDVKKEKN